MTAPHLRDLPDLARAVGSTCLRPVEIGPRDLMWLDVVADVAGWAPGWWGGCVHRKRPRYPLRGEPELWLLVIVDPPSQTGRRWKTTAAYVGRLPEWGQEHERDEVTR